MPTSPNDPQAAAEAARRRDIAALVRAAGLDPEVLDDADEQPGEDQP